MSEHKPSVAPHVTRIVIGMLVALCALSVLADVAMQLHLFGLHKHGEMGIDELPAFHAVFGFVSYVGLVLLAARVLRPLIMREEDYYDE
jgi:hypothetical protein